MERSRAAARPDLLLLGVSTRALAESVRRSGFRGDLLALDYFGDLDQERICRCLVPGRDVPGPCSAASLLRAAAALRPRLVVFSGGLENHPRLLLSLERRARILGNPARAVAVVRDPRRFFKCLDEAGIPHPRIWILPAEPRTGGAAVPRWRPARAARLLWKPRLGGGGVRIREVKAPLGAEPPGGCVRLPVGGYLQERVEGVPGSVSFVADGRRCLVLGFCRSLAGELALGASGYLYSGNLWGPEEEWLSPAARRTLARAAGILARRFGLRGLNGIDFVLRRGRPQLLEVNPRYTASMELIEEGTGAPLFALHRDACLRGRLPRASNLRTSGCRVAGWIGKAVVYADVARRVADIGPFLRAGARDIPLPGSRLRAGWPVCTLVARAATAEACRQGLLEQAALLRRDLSAGDRPRRASCYHSRTSP